MFNSSMLPLLLILLMGGDLGSNGCGCNNGCNNGCNTCDNGCNSCGCNNNMNTLAMLLCILALSPTDNCNGCGNGCNNTL